MPCDSITTQTISAALSKAMPELLRAALEAEGWSIRQSTAAGQLSAYRYGANYESLTWTAGKGITIDFRAGSAATNAATATATSIASLTQAYSKAAVT